MTQALQAELSVESRELTLTQIEALIGRPSDPVGRSKGEPARFTQDEVRTRSTWVFRLDLDYTVHAGTRGLDDALRGLPDELADQLAAAHVAGCEVVLGVVQHLSGSEVNSQAGIHLSSDAVTWLGRARALLDVDQYVD